jgi:hypothetical protein
MFSFILKSVFIEATILSLDAEHEKDFVLKKFITAFDDKALLENWLENRNIKCSTAIELLKNITKKVSDLISVINNDEFSVIKSMIMETNMVLSRIGYPYFETINIINSLQRILTINDKTNKSKSKMKDNLEETIFKEYDMIYKMLKLTILRFDFAYGSSEILGHHTEWSDKNMKFKESMCAENSYKSMIHLIGYANCVFESVLPTEIDRPTFFKVSSKGFGESIKCRDDVKYLFIREKTSKAYSEIMLPYFVKTRDKFILKKSNIKNYMNKSFLCDKTLTRELVKLFHYYSEIIGINTMYEITLKQDRKFQIKWSFLKMPSVEEIKNYWMNQEATDVSKLKISGKIWSVGFKKVKYLTFKSEDTDKQPIGTRLLVLSCGDLLGFKQIEEFLEKYYMKYTRPLNCPYCRQSISIVGSYDAIVYRLKQNTSCIIN